MNYAVNARIAALGAALVLLLAASSSVLAGDEGTCELKIRGHSIVRLMLIEKSHLAGVRFDRPGETVKLPAGVYRLEQVDLEENCSLRTVQLEWFNVSPDKPNELVVGAPLNPTVSVKRHGTFLQLDYDLVDGAGRSYRKTRDYSHGVPPPPRFTVSKDGRRIGSGSFEYG